MQTLTEEILNRLLLAKAYPAAEAGRITVFGLRSWSPDAGHSGTVFKNSFGIKPTPADYKSPHCTLGLWKPGSGFILFPGSTVPSKSAVEGHIGNPWGHVNQMMPGCYVSGWEQGIHHPLVAHRALIQQRPVVIRRTQDDATYQNTDPTYVDIKGYGELGGKTLCMDDIHCGRLGVDDYSSFGCQVVAGTVTGEENEHGSWKDFIATVYGGSQTIFSYLLFSPEEVQAAFQTDWAQQRIQVAYGSRGPAAIAIQEALAAKGRYGGAMDGEFDQNSVAALLKYERQEFNSASGVATPAVQDGLGIILPPVQPVAE